MSDENANFRPLGWGAFSKDLRFGARMLWKQPEFTIVAVLTLALGIGATAAIFSVVDSVLLRPLPYPSAEKIVLLTEVNSEQKIPKTGAPYLDYQDWQKQNNVFETMGAYWNVSGAEGVVLGGTATPERVRGSIVTSSLFTVLGAQPVIGRGFTPEEDVPGAGGVFLISDGFWRSSFGASRDAVGKKFQLDGEKATLIGVMPPGFQFPEKCDVWVPIGVLSRGNIAERVSHPFWALARLKPGVSAQRAQSDMTAIQRRLWAAYPATNMNWDVRVTPLLDEYVGNIRKSLLIIFGAVFFILLIACSNVANLLLVRSLKRQKEFSIRAALGAGRLGLLRQALTENLLLASISTVLALVLAETGGRLLVRFSAGNIPRIEGFHLNAPVLLFTVGLTIFTAILVGIGPAFRGADMNLQEVLRERTQTGSARSNAIQSMLVVAGVALTLLLLCGAGLMLKSFTELSKVNPGFKPDHLISVRVALPDLKYQKAAQRASFVSRLLADLKATPGVKDVGATTPLPLTRETNWQTVNVSGQPVLDESHAPSVELRTVTADYFKTMGIPMLEGRTFNGDDVQEAGRALVINQAMAKRFWPGQSAIGQHVTQPGIHSATREVIGVVGNIKHFGLDSADDPEMYVSGAGQYWASIAVVVRATSDPSAMVPVIRERVSSVDREVPIYEVATMDQLLAGSMAPYRFNLFLLGLFAVLALVLAGVGIYGQLAFSVTRRMHEIGVRMALGAQPLTILGQIVWQGMRLVLIGLFIGALASVAVMRLLQSLLYGVGSSDPLTYTGVTAVLILVAVLACGIPASRGMSVPPVLALRNE